MRTSEVAMTDEASLQVIANGITPEARRELSELLASVFTVSRRQVGEGTMERADAEVLGRVARLRNMLQQGETATHADRAAEKDQTPARREFIPPEVHSLGNAYDALDLLERFAKTSSTVGLADSVIQLRREFIDVFVPVAPDRS